MITRQVRQVFTRRPLIWNGLTIERARLRAWLRAWLRAGLRAGLRGVKQSFEAVELCSQAEGGGCGQRHVPSLESQCGLHDEFVPGGSNGRRVSQLVQRRVIECMDARLVDTFRDADLQAEIYSTDLPGEFKVIYRDASGKQLEEVPLTGISSYKQREPEIRARLHALKEGAKIRSTPDRGDAGEY